MDVVAVFVDRGEGHAVGGATLCEAFGELHAVGLPAVSAVVGFDGEMAAGHILPVAVVARDLNLDTLVGLSVAAVEQQGEVDHGIVAGVVSEGGSGEHGLICGVVCV